MSDFHSEEAEKPVLEVDATDGLDPEAEFEVPKKGKKSKKKKSLFIAVMIVLITQR